MDAGFEVAVVGTVDCSGLPFVTFDTITGLNPWTSHFGAAQTDSTFIFHYTGFAVSVVGTVGGRGLQFATFVAIASLEPWESKGISQVHAARAELVQMLSFEYDERTAISSK